MELPLSQRMPGQTVFHTTFGKGTVTFCTNVAIKVRFEADGEEAAFAFPYSFKQFFTAEDEALQREIVEFYDSGAWTDPIHDHHDCH